VVPLPVGAAARLCVFRVGAEANSIQNTGAAGYRGTNKAATGGRWNSRARSIHDPLRIV
jgi:hypothetical protein